LRHFIIYRDEIYGIDFESITEGSLSLDVGRMLAMYLYYDKIKSDFKLKVLEKVKEQILAEELIRPEDLYYSLRREEEMIKIRRDIH
jgi:predicted Ser/Thr protein kinase